MTQKSSDVNPHSLRHKRKNVQLPNAPHPRDIRRDQTRLSENMELLELFHYRDPSKKLSDTTRCSSENRQVLRILDIISVCFATGQEGDVVATMVGIHENNREAHFYLANNRSGEPSARQKDAVLKFHAMLAGAKKYEDLIPFVAKYSSRNVAKRVSKLRTGFDNVLSSPEIKIAIQAIDHNNVFLNQLLECRQLLRTRPGPDTEYRLLDTMTSCRDFVRLIESARQLERNDDIWLRLYGEVMQMYGNHLKDSDCLVENAKTLYRRLCKISQYRVLGHLIQFVNDHKGYIFKWVPDLFFPGRSGEMSIRPQSLEHIARSRIDELIKQRPQGQLRRKEYDAFVAKVKERESREDRRKWPNEFMTSIHCEIRIIRYCIEMFEKKLFAPRELIIGTSKRCCLFCDEWINRFNKIANFNFITGGSHGKAYRRAALTGVDEAKWIATDEDLMQGIDQHVINCIQYNIKTHRPKLLAPSDEYASSIEAEDCPDFANQSHSIGYTASIRQVD